jgi:3',5'-cyclic AMP phosphodiesterase CpdA
MARKWKVALLWPVVCVLLAAIPSPARAADPVVYAAGDVACDPADPSFNGGSGTSTACQQKATARLVTAPVDAVIALGDLQYDSATLANFQQSYDLSWGALKGLTRPVVGNHEGTAASTASGYCAYFGPAAHCNAGGTQGSAAFYSFDLGTWHVVVLNSNCTAAGGCGPGSRQYRWLAADLAANPRACSLAAWHHPRWSSGHDGNSAFMQSIWQLFYDSGGDLALAGHSHDYERFAPKTGVGLISATDGMRSFVVGTGGANFTGLGTGNASGSQVRQNTTFGVLRLVLHPTSYDWAFLPVAGGTFRDSGSQACRALPAPPNTPPPAAPDTQPPSVPAGLKATTVSRSRVGLAWAASTDNVGIGGYEIWRGIGSGPAAGLATTAAAPTTFIDASVKPGRRYVYRVRAKDAAGNFSALSGPTAAVTPRRRPGGRLLARRRLSPLAARRALARGWVRVGRRQWAPTVIRVTVGRRLAGLRVTTTRRAVKVRLAPWSGRPRNRGKSVTVTIRRPR